MGEHRVGRRAEHDVGVVGDRPPPVGGEPVADHVDVHALGHVGRRGRHVAGPGVVDPGVAGGDLGVVVVVDADVDQAGELLQGVAREVDLAVVGGVEVEDAVLHQAEADALPVVVQDGDPALVLRLPRHGPGVGHRVRVLVDQVLTPGHPGRVDRVRHRVLPVLVVERVGEVGPGLGDVRDVGVVQRLGQLALDQLAEHVDGGAHQHVELQAATQLGHRLVHGVERGDLHLALVLLGEAVDHRLVDVGHPVVDLQGGAFFRGLAAGDGLVAGEDGPLDRVVRAGQRDGAGAGQGGGARAEQRGGADGERGPSAAAEEGPAGQFARGAVALPAFSRVHHGISLLGRLGRRRRNSRSGGRCQPRRAGPRSAIARSCPRAGGKRRRCAGKASVRDCTGRPRRGSHGSW